MAAASAGLPMVPAHEHYHRQAPQAPLAAATHCLHLDGGGQAPPYNSRTSVRRRRGFTFIELLATVVLIAIIMPVAMKSIGLCTRLGGLSRRQIEAASLAKAKMTELIVTGDWQNGNQHGSFDEDWPGYEWKAGVTNWTDSTVRQLDLTVLWESMGRERTVTLSTLLYPEEN